MEGGRDLTSHLAGAAILLSRPDPIRPIEMSFLALG
jgi:hypothetical protein